MSVLEDRLNYPINERTRFRVRVELHEDLSGRPRVAWVRDCRTLEGAQRGYVALRDRTGYGASQFGFGAVFDEAGQHVASISYNGRLWAPSPDGTGPGWRPGVEPIAEAPSAEVRVRGLLTRLAAFSGTDAGPERSAEALRALAIEAEGLLRDPRAGLGQEPSDQNLTGVQVWAGGPGAGGFTQGPSPDLDFVDALEIGDLVQGFNARGGVLSEGVKTLRGVAWTRVHQADLDRARGLAADLIYETAEFGDVEILDCGGWESGGDTWRRTLFVNAERPEAPSRRADCVVQFHPASDEAVSLSLDGEELLIPEHDGNYPKIDPEKGAGRDPSL